MRKMREVVYKALSQHVIAVAVINTDVRDWAAYIDAVPGYNHEEEYMLIVSYGNKLSRKIAEAIFPEISNEYVWRN